jgi:hypothetical protein
VVCGLPEDGTDVPKRVGVVKDYAVVFVVCAFGFINECFKENARHK